MEKNKEKKLTYFMFAPHLEEGEKILLIAHRHPFLLIKGSLKIAFFGFLIPIFLWNVFPEIWFVFLVWVIVGFIQVNKMIFNWYYDVLLITTETVIDVKWDGPFHRTSERLEYSMIEGTTYAFRGILQTVFNYGDIQVNKQGGSAGLILKDAVNPARIEKVLMGYQEQYLEGKSMTETKKLKGLLSELVAKHVSGEEVEVKF